MTGMQRAVFRMYFCFGMKQEEIAQALGVCRPAVTMRVARIKERYRAAGHEPPSAPGRDMVTETFASTARWN